MEGFWATEVIRIYAMLLVGTWGVRAASAWFGEPSTRGRAWALRLVVFAITARWLGVW